MIIYRILKKPFLFTILALLISNIAFLQSPSVVITGKISGFNSLPVPGEVTLVYGGVSTDVTLDPSGGFSFTTLNSSPQKLEIKSSKEYLNGVNVGDIIAIYNHISKRKLITDPNRLIAANLKKDSNISISDVSNIRALLLGKKVELPDKKSWIFIDSGFPLQINNAFNAPEFILVDPNIPGTIHFKAIKLGDVN